MKPGDKYYDGPVVPSGKTTEEIEQEIKEEEKKGPAKWTPDMMNE